MLVINEVNLGPDGRYVNQYGETIQKIGQARLRALELLHCILTFLHPSYGVLAKAQIAANKEINVSEAPH